MNNFYRTQNLNLAAAFVAGKFLRLLYAETGDNGKAYFTFDDPRGIADDLVRSYRENTLYVSALGVLEWRQALVRVAAELMPLSQRREPGRARTRIEDGKIYFDATKRKK